MKKAGNIIGKIVTILVAAFAVFIMIFTIISVNTVGKDQSILGYKPYIVLSDSMNGVFEVGDIVVSEETDASQLKEGDIISFKSIDPNNYDAVVTHKIKGTTTYEGEDAFVTYGVNTGVEDAYPVPVDRIIGEYQFRLPKMGYFFQFLKTPMGYFILIFLPFIILIATEAVRFAKLLKKYKAEQAEALEEQKAMVKAEKLQAEQMKQEIERLRAELENRQNPRQ